MTLNQSWGYKANDNAWKTPAKVIHQLVEVTSKGGDFLLNVGPTAEGVIPAEAVTILAKVGEWLKVNGEAIYGATPVALQSDAPAKAAPKARKGKAANSEDTRWPPGPIGLTGSSWARSGRSCWWNAQATAP